MTFTEWLNEIKTIAADCDHIGVRVLPTETAPAIGETVANSYDWYEEEYGDGERRELDGASALDIVYAGRAANYGGRFVALIAGTDSQNGDDKAETIIREPRVIALFDRGSWA
jgi:hypothetical protein